MQHTDSQTQDWLHLRQLFYFKIGQLARERKALLINMTQCQMDMGHANDKLTQMTKWSDHLRENGAEEYRSFCMFCDSFPARGMFQLHAKSNLLPSMLVSPITLQLLPPLRLCVDACACMHTYCMHVCWFIGMLVISLLFGVCLYTARVTGQTQSLLCTISDCVLGRTLLLLSCCHCMS